MNAFFYYSGVAVWIALGIVGMLAGMDVAVDWIVQSLWTKRMFLEFVWSRLKPKAGET